MTEVPSGSVAATVTLYEPTSFQVPNEPALVVQVNVESTIPPDKTPDKPPGFATLISKAALST